MNSEVEQAQNNARIMGVMYGVVRGYELRKVPIIHMNLNYDTCIAAHCSYQELIDASKELVRYSDIVRKFLENEKGI